MSDTHAQTAKVQAEVQSGKPHIPPGHLDDESKAERPSGTRDRSIFPWLAAGVIAVAVVLLALAFLG